MLIPFYLWIPIWDSLYEKAKNKEIAILVFIVLNLLAGLHSFEIGTSVIDNIVFCLRRLPAFYVGWYLATLNIKGKKIPVISIPLGLVCFALGQKFFDCICWYWIAAFSVSIILGSMCNVLNNTWVVKLFNIMGSMSLELYLTNYFFMM